MEVAVRPTPAGGNRRLTDFSPQRRVLNRVLEIDLERCPKCGSKLKLIATILDTPVIERTLITCSCQLESKTTTREKLGDFVCRFNNWKLKSRKQEQRYQSQAAQDIH